MHISRKQRAIINSAVKPFYITSNYLGPGLQKLLKYYSKYFAPRRYSIVHFIPIYKNSRSSYLILNVRFNAFVKKGGFAKKRRPLTWTFYGNILLTKYGRKKQKKELKRKRKKVRRQKACAKKQNTRCEQPSKTTDGECVVIIGQTTSEDSNTNSNTNSNSNSNSISASNADPSRSNHEEDTEHTQMPANQCDVDTVTPEIPNENGNKSDSVAEKNDSADESVDNIWNLDIQEVAALITENGNDENQLSESTNDDTEDNSTQASTSNDNRWSDEQTNPISEEPQNQSEMDKISDINERLRQQLKLLKMGKSENFLFTTKETRPTANTQNKTSSSRRLNAHVSDESKKSADDVGLKSTNESHRDSTKQCDDENALDKSNEDLQVSKSNSGIIDSLFNKFQSMKKNLSTRSKTAIKLTDVSPINVTTPSPAKRYRRDDTSDGQLCTTFDSTHEDSNQSANSVSMEFLGFDISNKNVDVSALLPTPKVLTSNEQAAFVSEYLDIFMKENSLEKSNDQILFAPRRQKADEALMTTDAEPPNLSVPERPMDMQRPRTLAEKRMILQQQNDISLLIIENESTVYHELKKRVRQGSAYDNTLMRSIQDANIPFTRDCWRATCWISTANNRFFYRTLLYDDEEIKLTGSRGNNMNKIAFKLDSDEKIPYSVRTPKHILAECPTKCLPIEGIQINNIETIVDETKVKTESALQANHKYGLLKRSKLCMFSREYLTPGPKCKKVNCKANRKTSFDLEYGPLELVQLPTVQLEVWPQVGLPLSDQIKPILKTIPTNSNVITAEWAKFAVSVVRENPKQIKHRRKYKKPELEKPQSITFNIPYENHEKMILIRRRRRSAIVFNKTDTKYEAIESFYRDDNRNQLTFAKDVDPTDTLAVECADILTSMIESVAIAVNDTNFIKQDPDIDYVGKIIEVDNSKDSNKAANKTEKDKQCAKAEKPAKSKLIKELRRLNVTVIDTAEEMVKAKPIDEVCQKPFCKMGCVCTSIDNAKYIQTHCQLYDCMFSCSCINTPFKEANSFYLNNNIDLLQARANARLAKEEKEFKSTIIMSENDMFVLPNSSTATKRSSKKPKRFTNDETCLDDTETETIFKSKRRRPAEKMVDAHPVENRQRSSLLKSLQHVRVVLKQLPEIGVEPWCMVHCLYKCHCKGRAQKGRIFNFANKKNDITGPGGWDLITPRKRQYTFERDNASADEPSQKSRKTISTSEISDSHEPSATSISSARTSVYNWKNEPRRSAQELKKLRNECMFIEDQKSDLLNQRIIMCRKYNQAQNMLTKSMENGRLVRAHANLNPIANGSIQSANKPTNAALQRLNHVITDTMHRLTALQERNQLTLNPTPNKMSIVPWDRMLQAFKTHDVYIWDVLLKGNLRLLVLTTTYTKPKSDNFLHITNINYADINSLPMVAKLLRNEYQTEKTKYLAMVLLRITHFWRICGVLHSDLKYMDDELRAKPTPDQNPLLGRKINTLYQLLTKCSGQNTESSTEMAAEKSIQEIANDNFPSNVSSIECTPSISLPPDEQQSSVVNEIDDDDDDDDDIKEVKMNNSIPYFENTSMRLSLPIPVDSKQRLLMINVGDDFTHVWFPSWHKFLSIKRIQNSFILSKRLGKAIEMSQSNNYPKVFVSHSHDNCIFIGPYGNTDRQNLALFLKHENHMMLSELYYKEFGSTYTKKTKASWIYPSSSKHGKPAALKINQVYSKHDIPSEIANDGTNTAKDDGISASTSTDEHNQPTKSGFFMISNTNGVKTVTFSENKLAVESDDGSEKPSQMAPGTSYIPTNIVEMPIRLVKPNVVPNSYRNTNPLALKISSVVSGEEAAFMTNGLDIESDEPDADADADQTQNSDIESFTPAQDTEINLAIQPKEIVANANANELNQTLEAEDNDDILLEPKTEPIDISDDEQIDYEISEIDSNIDGPQADKIRLLKGYIYCSTNIQLGKINMEWSTPTCIKLYLEQPVDIECEESTLQLRQRSLVVVSKFMQSYIRSRFYGVYPAHLRLDWIFVETDKFDQEVITLCDFNTVEPFSVIFKDKIVNLNSNYRDDTKIPIKDIYVLDIYQLASQLFSEEDVKTMKISEILRKSRQIDAELVEIQTKLQKVVTHYHRKLMGFKNTLGQQTKNQNGEI